MARCCKFMPGAIGEELLFALQIIGLIPPQPIF